MIRKYLQCTEELNRKYQSGSVLVTGLPLTGKSTGIKSIISIKSPISEIIEVNSLEQEDLLQIQHSKIYLQVPVDFTDDDIEISEQRINKWRAVVKDLLTSDKDFIIECRKYVLSFLLEDSDNSVDLTVSKNPLELILKRFQKSSKTVFEREFVFQLDKNDALDYLGGPNSGSISTDILEYSKFQVDGLTSYLPPLLNKAKEISSRSQC